MKGKTMSDFGIVSEFNPFHNGHKYLFDRARELFADRIVCVMSGNAVQRGEFAVADKYSRAKAAIECGADLVLELPYPWCAASAEYFGRAAVYGLKDLCGELIFGSETGDAELLCRAAETCESEFFKAEYARRLSEGEGAASAYAELLGEYGYSDLRSNDLLALSYIRACISLDAPLGINTVKRIGAVINEENIIEGNVQSATAIRAIAGRGELDKIVEFVPNATFRMLSELSAAGKLTDTAYIDRAVIAYIRGRSGEELESFAECGGGLGYRVKGAADESIDMEGLLSLARTKRYTDAKIRRAILFALTGVKNSDLSAMPEYMLLLAANEKGRAMLSENRKNGGIRIITKPSDAPRDSRQYKLGEALEGWFTLARREADPLGAALKRGPYVEKQKNGAK